MIVCPSLRDAIDASVFSFLFGFSDVNALRVDAKLILEATPVPLAAMALHIRFTSLELGGRGLIRIKTGH